MSLVILFHFLCTQHVSDINISIIRSLRLCCWITTSAVLFLVRCVLEIWCEHSRKLLMMDILMSETCWVHKKWNKITIDIKLVFYSSSVELVLCIYNIHSKTWVLLQDFGSIFNNQRINDVKMFPGYYPLSEIEKVFLMSDVTYKTLLT